MLVPDLLLADDIGFDPQVFLPEDGRRHVLRDRHDIDGYHRMRRQGGDLIEEPVRKPCRVFLHEQHPCGLVLILDKIWAEFQLRIADIVPEVRVPLHIGIEVEIEFLLLPEPVVVMQDPQPLLRVQRDEPAPDLPEELHEVYFQRIEAGLRLLEILPLHGDREVPLLLDALLPFDDPLRDDLVVNHPIAVETVALVGKQHLLPQLLHVLVLIVDRDLEFHVQRVEQAAVPLEDRHLLLLRGRHVVDIRK